MISKALTEANNFQIEIFISANTTNAEQKISRFNIRVYRLFIHEGSLLITDEYRLRHYLRKFPGGLSLKYLYDSVCYPKVNEQLSFQ